MPKLGREPFVRQMPHKKFLQPEKELFYCKHTKEIFTDYESLFQRVILCNSLLWTCSVTARPGLTFQEAVESEQKARTILASFPEALKRPVLFLATQTHRARIGDLCDDVYSFARERYFEGEIVETVINGTRKTCEISSVLSPLGEKKSPDNKAPSPKAKAPNTSPSKQRYEVCEVTSRDSDDIQECYIALGQDINRPKGSYNKDKNKLFIKQHVTFKDGILVVKDNVIKKKNLQVLSVSSLTGGSVNAMEQGGTPNKNGTSSSNVKKKTSAPPKKDKMDINQALMQKHSAKKSSTSNLIDPSLETYSTEEERAKRRDEIRHQFEVAKLKRKMDKDKEKERMKEEKRLIAEFMCEYNKPRDDLECDDLKELPIPTPIQCHIPQTAFGDAMMVAEFLHDFGHLLYIKGTFPQGLTFEILDKAICNTDIDGPFNDLLQLLLLAVFKQQEAEDEEQKGLNRVVNIDELQEDDFDRNTAKAMQAAKVAASWPLYCQGVVLRKLPLDPFTLTELVRLHFLASGSEVCARFNERGMYNSRENPGLYLKMDRPDLFKELASASVFQLSPENRVTILKTLVEQLLTYEVYRDCLEEFVVKFKSLNFDLKQLRWAHTRRSREEKKNKLEGKENVDKTGSQTEDNAGVNHPVQPLSEEEKAKKAEEDAKCVEEFLKKEKELFSELSRLKGAGALIPIGRDRAFRRYWIFRSVSGVFVEDEDPFIGQCLLKPTPTNPTPPSASQNGIKSQEEVPLSFMKHFLSGQKMSEDKNGQSDKENEACSTTPHTQNGHKNLLSDANPRMNSPSKGSRSRSAGESLVGQEAKTKLTTFGMCNSDINTCFVHSASRPQIRWSYFYKAEEIDQLIGSLNPRGHRESRLREYLIKEKNQILQGLNSCPAVKLNLTLPDEESTNATEIRKSTRGKASSYANLHPEDALETTFREALLDNEEKVYSGALGCIKVKDREAWRKAIHNRGYEMQCDKLSWGDNNFRLQGESMDTVETCSSNDGETTSQRSSSPTVSSQTVSDLACALLQIAQGVETRYLTSPLAEDEKFKKDKNKAMAQLDKLKKGEKSDEGESEEEGVGEDQMLKKKGITVKMPKSPLHRWQESLMKCTSLSQLFIYLATLEKSVSWNKSASKACCRLCRRKGDPESMLLCDGCNRGYHMYCLKPPLKSVPPGDWFCPPCEPPVPKLNRKGRNEVTDSEEEPNGDEDEEENDSSEDDYEDIPDESEEEEAEENQVCKICNEDGILVCCETCSQCFHADCLKPPLRRVPRGAWHCVKCTAKNSKKTQRVEETSEVRSSTRMGDRRNKETVPPRASRRLAQGSSPVTAGGSRHLPLDYQSCSTLLTQLGQHPDAWPFLRAVTKKEAPTYHRIIKHPMDLGLLRSRLNNQAYSTNGQYLNDICLMFNNCELFNDAHTDQYESGKRLSKYFHTLVKQYKLDDSPSTSSSKENSSGGSRKRSRTESANNAWMPKKRKTC